MDYRLNSLKNSNQLSNMPPPLPLRPRSGFSVQQRNLSGAAAVRAAQSAPTARRGGGTAPPTTVTTFPQFLTPEQVQHTVLTRGALLALACDVVLRTPEEHSQWCPSTAADIHGRVIGFHPHHADAFAQHVLPRLEADRRVRVVVCVIDHAEWSSDVSFPPATSPSLRHPSEDYIRRVLASPAVAHWFLEDAWLPDPLLPVVGADVASRITRLPIGLAWKKMRQPTVFAALQRALRDAPPVNAKTPTALSTYHFVNYGQPRSRWTPHERRTTHQQLLANPCVYRVLRRTDETQCWAAHAPHAFEICVPGNGLDCHRTWEALMLNTIPLVPHSPLDVLHRQFPIVIVERWSDVTPERLAQWQRELAPLFAPDFALASAENDAGGSSANASIDPRRGWRTRLTTAYWARHIRSTAARIDPLV